MRAPVASEVGFRTERRSPPVKGKGGSVLPLGVSTTSMVLRVDDN